jgi:hypothetical protein
MDFHETFAWQALPFWVSVYISFFADVFEAGGEIGLLSAELKS